MRARDVMTAPVITVTPWMSAKAAAKLLSAHGFTALPVVDDDERLIGIVTEVDLIRGQLAHGPGRREDAEAAHRRGRELAVESVMTTPVTGMGAGADLAGLCQVFVEDCVRAVPIVDGSTVVGIVTRGDIVRVLARDGALGTPADPPGEPESADSVPGQPTDSKRRTAPKYGTTAPIRQD